MWVRPSRPSLRILHRLSRHMPTRLTSSQCSSSGCHHPDAAGSLHPVVWRCRRDGLRGTYEFLESIDAESIDAGWLLTLAMLAAGDDASAVVRFFDTKTHDLPDAPIVLSDFLSWIDMLCLQRGCLTSVGSHHTYTSYTLAMLQDPRPLI